MFQCTGSEANDLAIRVAQTYTRGEGVMVPHDECPVRSDLHITQSGGPRPNG